MMNKQQINVEYCDLCKSHVKSLGYAHFHEYTLTCGHYSKGWIRCVHEPSYNSEVIRDLELLGYLITTEKETWIKIKPKGIIPQDQFTILFCIDPKHKNPSRS